MERILTVEQMKHADSYTIEKLGILSNELTERAGFAIYSEIIKRFKGGRVLVCIGKGNNGEDGKVVAKLLSKIHGFSVGIFNVSNGFFKVPDNSFDIIVDCIFGTGLNRDVEGKYFDIIEKINKSNAYIISCDIPSGLNGNTGFAMGIAVKANLTIAIQEYKVGHFLNDGKDYCGELIVKDIGISVWDDDIIYKFSDIDARKFFEKRKNNSNKGCFGKACILGGSVDYPGSVLLATNAILALKMGIGYSNVATIGSLVNQISSIHPECTFTSFSDNGKTLSFSKEKLDELLKYNAIVFGMGVGISEDVYKSLYYLIENYKGRLIIDADGLNCLSKYGLDILLNKKCEVVLTPHVGEFSRLINVDKQSILEDAVKFAKNFADKYRVILVLKNAVSIITDGESVYLNTTGNCGMAKAGSGDTLDGIMAGISCRNYPLIECVACSCYIFGKAGDIALKKSNVFCLTASDITNCITETINNFI